MATAVMYPNVVQASGGSEPSAPLPRGMFIGTPEIYFTKRIDNSRVVKVADPRRRREMISLSITLCVAFLFALVYLWQHFSAIEYGYRIEQLKVQRDAMVESNRALGLEEATLKNPARIDQLAQQMGMHRPVAGQWQPMNSETSSSSAPVLAKAGGIVVVPE